MSSRDDQSSSRGGRSWSDGDGDVDSTTKRSRFGGSSFTSRSLEGCLEATKLRRETSSCWRRVSTFALCNVAQPVFLGFSLFLNIDTDDWISPLRSFQDAA